MGSYALKTNHFSLKDELWEEFVSNYPKCCTRPDGRVDLLKIRMKNAKSDWDDLTSGREEKKREIINALKAQVENYTETNKMAYFRRIYNWFRQEEWLIGLALMESNEQTKNVKNYGTRH